MMTTLKQNPIEMLARHMNRINIFSFNEQLESRMLSISFLLQYFVFVIFL